MTARTLVRRIAILAALAAAAAVALLPARPVEATGWKANVAEGSEIVMQELLWPVWDQGTYYCFWYNNFLPNKYTTFYGGLVSRGAKGRTGMFMTYWNDIGYVHEGPQFYTKGYGAEGAKGGVSGNPDFLRPNSWYRMVMRVFPPVEGGEKRTFVGWWIKDVAKDRWYTHSVVSLASHETGMTGGGGFVEALAPETVPRAFERRLGYGRIKGKWYKSNRVAIRDPSEFKLIEGGTVMRYDRPVRDNVGQKDTTYVTTEQPDLPILDTPMVESARARAWENQVAVAWSIPTSASPQLGYRIEAFAEPEAKGKPIGTARENAPHVTAKRFDATAPVKSVRLTVTDIFDQVKSVVVPVAMATPVRAAAPARLRSGLRYAYYEATQGVQWERLPDFAAMEPVRQGCVRTLDDTVREARTKLYAIRYAGYLRAPASGLYVLTVGTSDGSRLSIGGKVVADNDGVHSASVRQYPIALSEGLHAFELSCFRGTAFGKGSGTSSSDTIRFLWEGPGFERRQVGAGDFQCEDRGDIPSIALTSKGTVTDGVLDDNLVTIRAATERRGQRLERVQLYRGRQLLKSKAADGGDLAETAFAVLLPEGDNPLWARLWYGGGSSVDSKVMALKARTRTEGPWTFDVLGKTPFPMAARYVDGRMSFTGQGFYSAHQKVAGDFTLTARIADIELATKENGVHRSNWLGLYIQQRVDRAFQGRQFGIYRTAGNGVRGNSDYPDLAGTRVSMQVIAKEAEWLRMVRRGDRCQSFISADGRTWEKATEFIHPRLPRDMYVGVCFRSVPGKGRTFFRGDLDNVTLTQDVAKEPRSAVRKDDLPRVGQVLAIIQASKTPGTLYARKLGRGLLKSTDAGETWKACIAGGQSGSLIRSVAVHPTDSSIVLCGGASHLDTFVGLMGRSADGGKTWKLVSTAVDFGVLLTASFGEVIAFCPSDPNLVAAGGDTNGLFLSRDAGVTWEYVGLKGERITCLGFIPTARKDRPTLIVGTIDDDEFKTLGLGELMFPTEAPGRIYWVEFRGEKVGIKKSLELADFGVTNIGFGWHENFITFATTRGVYYTWQHGNVYAQRRHDMPSDMLVTALGHRLFLKELRKNDTRLRATTYAAPFSSDDPSPVYSAVDRTTARWSILSRKAKVEPAGKALSRGVTCILAGKTHGTLFLCNRQGVFKSTDNGKSYRLVFANSP